jgi:hypothetical protein
MHFVNVEVDPRLRYRRVPGEKPWVLCIGQLDTIVDKDTVTQPVLSGYQRIPTIIR